jgi:hypothetical protein
MRESFFLCGGKGELTPEAKAELESFRNHLTNHQAQHADWCRFCAERLHRARTASSPSPERPE